ncbi:dihydrodipicolinate synthase family protein [Pseudarthrobacter sp. CC12]|uniref:dihydrodipicolinate synthase family protein n=1 Tax=Pseudarthrobacter sp. CC12 TaxID=3029193 RepID=UPI00326447D1
MKEGLPVFNGLSAFPLTPMKGEDVDLEAVALLVSRAARAGVDSLGILGSTGNYAYLSPAERRAVLHTAVDAADGVPVLAGIGAVRTRDVLGMAADAQTAGASAMLLAPVSYQRLNDEEVFGLYERVASESEIPVVVYDNPGTTGFTFSDDFHARIARIPRIASIKIPPPAQGEVSSRIRGLRAQLPHGTSLGISGDWVAAEALIAGSDVWYSVLGGLLPAHAKAIVDHVRAGRNDQALQASEELEPLWTLFRAYGSLRVVSALAEILGLVPVTSSLPLPVRGLDREGRERVAGAIRSIGLDV